MSQITLFGKSVGMTKMELFTNKEYYDFLIKSAGQQVMIVITSLGDEGTIAQKVYYNKGIIPYIRRGFLELGEIYNNKQVDEELKRRCPVTNELQKIDGHWVDKILSEEEMTKKQWSAFIDWCIMFGATELNITIPEPEERL